MIVVLLVALLALTGAALLDIVDVDLSLAAEHSKIVRAQMVSDGALREVLADVNTGEQLPDFVACAGQNGGNSWGPGATCPNYRYNWANEIGTPPQHIKNPDSVNFASEALDEDNSAYAKWTSLPESEENYTATVDLLRIVPIEDSSLPLARAVLYEVSTAGKVGGNRSRAETTSQIFKITIRPTDSLPPRLHGR